jgi:hypothetical protein
MLTSKTGRLREALDVTTKTESSEAYGTDMTWSLNMQFCFHWAIARRLVVLSVPECDDSLWLNKCWLLEQSTWNTLSQHRAKAAHIKLVLIRILNTCCVKQVDLSKDCSSLRDQSEGIGPQAK